MMAKCLGQIIPIDQKTILLEDLMNMNFWPLGNKTNIRLKKTVLNCFRNIFPFFSFLWRPARPFLLIWNVAGGKETKELPQPKQWLTLFRLRGKIKLNPNISAQGRQVLGLQTVIFLLSCTCIMFYPPFLWRRRKNKKSRSFPLFFYSLINNRWNILVIPLEKSGIKRKNLPTD